MQSAIAHSRRIITVTLAAGSLMLPLAVAAATSSNNMIPNGCTTRATCTKAVDGSDLQSFYAAHDVTAATLHDAIHGSVTNTGQVIVGGKVIATGAQSYGRTFISGSVQDGPVYRRPTSVSFAATPLAALVYAPNGQFKYAVIESCGNLVTAMQVAPPAPKPATPQAAVKVVPAPQVTQVNNNVQVVKVQAQPAPKPPTPTPASPKAVVVTPPAAPSPAAAALPQTGASTVGLVGLAALLTVSGYYFRSRRGLRWALLSNRR